MIFSFPELKKKLFLKKTSDFFLSFLHWELKVFQNLTRPNFQKTLFFSFQIRNDQKKGMWYLSYQSYKCILIKKYMIIYVFNALE